MSVVDEIRDRSRAFLTATDYFDELGLEKLGADARMIARLALELADELDAERSARVAIQEARDRCQEVLARRRS